MAARTLVVTTPAIAGTSVVSASSALASSDTCTISVTTAQSSIDFATMVIRATNANSITSVILSISAGTEYSDIGIGSASITVATGDTSIIGGQFFEGSRFLSSGNTVVLTATGTGPTTLEAYQSPKATE